MITDETFLRFSEDGWTNFYMEDMKNDNEELYDEIMKNQEIVERLRERIRKEQNWIDGLHVYERHPNDEEVLDVLKEMLGDP